MPFNELPPQPEELPPLEEPPPLEELPQPEELPPELPPQPDPPVVDVTTPVYVGGTYVPDIPLHDRVKQTASVLDADTVWLLNAVQGFEPINTFNPAAWLAYLAETSNGEWELGYLSGFSQAEMGTIATRHVDAHHSSSGLTTLGGVERIAVDAQVTISLVQRSNAGTCAGGSPTVTQPKAAAFGDTAVASALCSTAIGHKVTADRLGGTTVGSAGLGYLGVDVAGHQTSEFVLAAQTSDWTTPCVLTNNQRGLSTGYTGTGLVKAKATVIANYMRLDGGTPAMTPPSEITVFEVTADLYVVDRVVTTVLTQQVTPTFVGANSQPHTLVVSPTGDLSLASSVAIGPSRAVAFVTINDLSQSVYT